MNSKAAAAAGVALALVSAGPASAAPKADVESIRLGTSASPRSQFPAFARERGRFTAFEAADPTVQLFPGGINDRGEITGEYLAPTRESGFLRGRRGRTVKIDLPGAAGTQVEKTNNRGQIVGASSEAAPFLPNDETRGFVLRRGKVTRVDVPGAVQTVPHGINGRGEVVGSYVDERGKQHGFVLRKGVYTRLDAPGRTETAALAINDRGGIVGIAADADGAIHGFLRSHGAYTTIDAPGAASTIPYDINDHGQIVGSSFNPTDADPYAGARGFLLREGAKGPFTPVRVTGARRTLATGINDRGQIVGIYENPRAVPASVRARSQSAMPVSGLLLGLGRSGETR